MNLAQEIANLAKFYPRSDIKDLDVQFPNWNEAKLLYRDMGISAQLPDYSDDLWTRVHSLIWTEYRRRRNELILAKPKQQVQPVVTVAAYSASADEARVRSMKGYEVASVLASLGLSVEPHPTNAGITVMRGKNKLLHYVRQGKPLAVSQQSEAPIKKAKKTATWTVGN